MSTLGELRELAKKYGKEYGREFILWALENGIFKQPNEVDKDKNKGLYGKAGCKNSREYYDKLAQKLGYRNNSERAKIRGWNKGKHSPMSENEDLEVYFGALVEEIFKKFLLMIFGDVKHMDYGNRGFDFICKNPRKEFIDNYPQFKLERNKEYKIQCKARCLSDHRWGFDIRHNNMADYFILSGWNNREDLEPMYIWIFHKDDIVRERKFWMREKIGMANKPEYLAEFKKWEITNMLEKLKKLCNERMMK